MNVSIVIHGGEALETTVACDLETIQREIAAQKGSNSHAICIGKYIVPLDMITYIMRLDDEG